MSGYTGCNSTGNPPTVCCDTSHSEVNSCPVCPNTHDPSSPFYFSWVPSIDGTGGTCEDDKGDTESPIYETCPVGQICYNGQGCGFSYNNGAGFTTGQLPCPTPGTGGSTKCDTAIGKIDISATGLVKSLFAIILSIAGVLAVLLIIISGYRLTTSQGNPENIQHAREQLTAAIVGLLFVILSFTILRLIGIDILNLAQQ